MESFSPGYRLQDNDLNITFYARGIAYPPELTYSFSPVTLSYEVDFLNSDGRALLVGPLNRVPQKVNDVTYRANFIVDNSWATGIYQIVWKYKTYTYSDTQTIIQDFEILNNGVADVPFVIKYCRRNLPALFNVLIDAQDLPAEFTIIP